MAIKKVTGKKRRIVSRKIKRDSEGNILKVKDKFRFSLELDPADVEVFNWLTYQSGLRTYKAVVQKSIRVLTLFFEISKNPGSKLIIRQQDGSEEVIRLIL